MYIPLLKQEKMKDNNKEFVNLSEWIGEGFKSNVNSSDMLEDIDEEFLGWSANDEKRISSWGKNKKNTILNQNNVPTESVNVINPQKLLLVHKGKHVAVQCLFVEVKSANDTLDERQEDWLNILDKVGNSRLCK